MGVRQKYALGNPLHPRGATFIQKSWSMFTGRDHMMRNMEVFTVFLHFSCMRAQSASFHLFV